MADFWALGGAWGCLVADGRWAVSRGAWWLMTRIVEREVNWKKEGRRRCVLLLCWAS